jgi:polysaccharide export outer membrane protein
MKKMIILGLLLVLGFAPWVAAQESLTSESVAVAPASYTVGPMDVLGIEIIEPDKIATRATVSPDGSITAPYIGQVNVSGLTTNQIRQRIEQRLADGYLKFPSVMVSLLESHSRKFFVYGAVIRPGEYDLPENMTVLRAISMTGGFTKFGSSSRVKVLRALQDRNGYENIKININAVMNGDSQADLAIEKGDIIVVSEGIF